MKKVIIIISILVIFSNYCYSQCKSSYDLWLIPQKSNINLGDSMKVKYGITGYGYIDIFNSKILIVSESETHLYFKGMKMDEQNESVLSMLEKSMPTNIYDTNRKVKPSYPNVGLYLDLNTEFSQIIAYPKTAGDKKLDFILTYKCGDEWKTCNKEFNYHVNSFSEEHEKAISFFTFIVGIIGVLALIPNNVIHNFFVSITKKIKVLKH